MSREGYEKLKSEIDNLKSIERQKVARQIAEAREKGDLSENAEYDAAKEAQGLLELKINQLEEILANARVVNEADLENGKISISSPIARALIGKEEGDVATFSSPGGSREVEILSVNYV
jgi:transcription elongation factor GreA